MLRFYYSQVAACVAVDTDDFKDNGIPFHQQQWARNPKDPKTNFLLHQEGRKPTYRTFTTNFSDPFPLWPTLEIAKCWLGDNTNFLVSYTLVYR